MSWLWCHGCAQKGPFHKVGAEAENDLAPKVASMCPLGCSKTIEECSLYLLSHQMFTGPRWHGQWVHFAQKTHTSGPGYSVALYTV